MKIKKNFLDTKSRRKENVKTKTDKELAEKIQNQYIEYRSGGYWLCDCGRKRYFKKVMSQTEKKIVLKVKCTRCFSNIERFIAKGKEEDFHSEEFDTLFKRYKNKIKSDCANFKLEDSDDIYGDMTHRFFIAVMTYDGRSSFSTYFTNLKNRRFEDFERKFSRSCRTVSVQCQACGRWPGAITRNHLMMNKKEPLKGFPGHEILHDKIIDDYGRDKFNYLDNENTKELNSKHWEGNDYNKTQRKLIKSNIVQVYREMFPNSIISMNNVYLSDKDPETETEYINMIEDNNTNVTVDGFVKNDTGNIDDHFFVVNNVPSEIKDMCSDYAYEIGNKIFDNFKDVKRMKKFKSFNSKEVLINTLERTFSLMLLGYTISDISEVENYELKELKFWLKYIKNTKELKTTLNFN